MEVLVSVEVLEGRLTSPVEVKLFTSDGTATSEFNT